MSIFVDVLRYTMADVFLFCISFALTLVSFSMMLWMQLGPVVDDFSGNVEAALGLARGIFSDIDIDEVLHNSSGYFNVVLYLTYLFIAVFIMLSLFLSLLAEGFMKIKGQRGWRADG